MSKVDSPAQSSTLDVFNNQQFTENEILILKLLLAKKVKSSIMEKTSYIAHRVCKALQDNDNHQETSNLVAAFRSVTAGEFQELTKTAKCLGISNERLNELDAFVYEIETGQFRF